MSAPSTHDRETMNAGAGCPVNVDDIDLFAPGSQEHWYEAYSLLHEESPVLRIPGGGKTPGTDAYVITKYEDISRIIRDPEAFPPSELRQASDEAAEIFRETGLGTPADTRQSLRPRPGVAQAAPPAAHRSLGRRRRRRAARGHDPFPGWLAP